jgi:hypothetical protein
VSRQDLRAVETCPDLLKPLAELQGLDHSGLAQVRPGWAGTGCGPGPGNQKCHAPGPSSAA